MNTATATAATFETATETKVAVIPARGNEEEKALAREVSDIELQAESFIVETDEDYKLACEFGRTLKRKSAEVAEFFKPMKDAAYQAHRAVCDRENTMLKPLKNAEIIIKASVGAYIEEQNRKQRELEEAMRRAAEEERERRLKAAMDAEAAGKKEEAAEALNEAIIMDGAKDSVTVYTNSPSAAGTTVAKDWEITSINSDDVPIEFNGMVIRPVDEKAIIRLIRASKGTIKIPGVSYKESAKIAFRRK